MQAQPDYSGAIGDYDYFKNRDQDSFALERGHGWRPRAHIFFDPSPVPASARAAYEESVRQRQIRYDQAQAEEKAQRLAAKEARRLAIEQRLVAERRKSDEKLQFREQILALPLAERVQRLALDDGHSVNVYPIEPATITSQVLLGLDRDTRERLLLRVSRRWALEWKRLAQRIRNVIAKIDGQKDRSLLE